MTRSKMELETEGIETQNQSGKFSNPGKEPQRTIYFKVGYQLAGKCWK